MTTPDRNTTDAGSEDEFPGPDEGGKRGENTAFAGGYSSQPSENMIEIDAGIQQAYGGTAAGPNSDADTLVEDPNASRDNRA